MDYSREELEERLMIHEHGHSIQSIILGPLYVIMAVFAMIWSFSPKYSELRKDIASHKLVPPGGYIYEDDLVNISADPEIPIVGFVVLGISKHVKSMNELTRDDRIHIMDVLNTTIENMKHADICKEVLLIQEERASHLHIWIVPIHEWMEEFDKSVTNIREIIDYSKKNFDEKTKEDLLNAIELLKEEFYI